MVKDSLHLYVNYIISDCYRYIGVRRITFYKIIKCYLAEVGFRFTFWLRLAKCVNPLISIPSRLISRHLRHKYHIFILWPTQIGYGFKIPHGEPCVINSSAVIGDNVNILQFSTIGSSSYHAAHIGNDVYIGPSVSIVEGVNIGDGVTIGAGAVVVKDVPRGVTIAGVPAKIISHKEPGRLVVNKWKVARSGK